MKKLLLLWLAVFAFAAAVWVGPVEKETVNAAAPFAVVELFTSQGCSSCPPADALLKKINSEAQRSGKNIYVLSFHVDYWNYIGWKDPFSSKTYSDRQRQYAQAFRSRRIYTPQAIVNGKQDVVGSQEGALRQFKTVSVEQGNSDGSISFTLNSDYTLTNLRVIAYVQARGTMHIYAAASEFTN